MRIGLTFMESPCERDVVYNRYIKYFSMNMDSNKECKVRMAPLQLTALSLLVMSVDIVTFLKHMNNCYECILSFAIIFKLFSEREKMHISNQ